MFCPKCGKQLRENTNFCEYCGYKIPENTNNEDGIYSESYYKNGFKKQNSNFKKNEDSIGKSFLKGLLIMIVILLSGFVLLIGKNYFSNDLLSLDRIRYQQYIDDPSLIPELSEPETLHGLVDNLKDVQNFLLLYMKVSDDDMDTKMETFDKYRKEILKMRKFDNTNFLQENVKYQMPRDEKEFKTVQKQYSKILSKVGLMIVADDSYSKYHLEEDARFTYKKFGKYVPNDVSIYLKLRAKYYQPCMFNSTLTIKPFKLARRIGDYEDFLRANQNFRYKDEVQDLLFSYTFIYSFTSDRTDIEFLNKKVFLKSDKKLLKKYPTTQFKELFGHLINSANGISEAKFDEVYPYEYEKNLKAIMFEKTDLTDIFSIIRKNIVSAKSDDSYKYVYISDNSSWAVYDATRPLKRGDLILAETSGGYDVYDYKYKRTNQRIDSDEGTKFIIKRGCLLAYSSSHLQISSLENVCGGLSFKTLSPRMIKKFFPNVLLIDIDKFTDTSVQINKETGAKTYMLISTSGIDYSGYRLSGNITIGELNNMFTVSSDVETQVNWTCDGNGDSYHIYFVTQQANDTTQNPPAVDATTN